jgi:hypothetical protein
VIANVLIRKEPFYRRDAIERGLKRVGFAIDTTMAHPRQQGDWLVLWNRKAGVDDQRATLWEQRGGIVIVMENGYLQKVDKTYYAVSVHGHNGSGWFPVDTGEDRFTKLGFAIMPWRSGGTETLVRTQRGVGTPLMANPPRWAEEVYEKIRRTNAPVRLVQHPGNHMSRTLPLKELANAKCLVTWASSFGVLALVEGVPVFYAAPYWICEQGAQPFKYFPKPFKDDERRQTALHKMSHGQWHFEEIAAGEPFKRILDNLEHATWR